MPPPENNNRNPRPTASMPPAMRDPLVSQTREGAPSPLPPSPPPPSPPSENLPRQWEEWAWMAQPGLKRRAAGDVAPILAYHLASSPTTQTFGIAFACAIIGIAVMFSSSEPVWRRMIQNAGKKLAKANDEGVRARAKEEIKRLGLSLSVGLSFGAYVLYALVSLLVGGTWAGAMYAMPISFALLSRVQSMVFTALHENDSAIRWSHREMWTSFGTMCATLALATQQAVGHSTVAEQLVSLGFIVLALGVYWLARRGEITRTPAPFLM